MKINEDSFSYEAEVILPEKGPRWDILSDCNIKLQPGFNPSGTQMGLFAPTNKDNVPDAPKKSYLTDPESRMK